MTDIYISVLEAGKFKTNVLADWMSGEDPLPGSQMGAFLLYAHMVFLGLMLMERQISVSSSSCKDINP